MRGLRGWIGARPWHLALAAVAIAYSIVQLLFTAKIGLGWDESVYVSQVARGVPLLVAPVALFTSSVMAVRGYLSLLSGIGLFLAYRPWLSLRDSPLVPFAAALFAGLWLSLFYGNEAMPNLWVAYGGVAGVALFCLASRKTAENKTTEKPEGRWLVPAGLVAAFAVASLTRPTDATWLALPLVGYGLIKRRWLAVSAVAGGLAIGWGEWCVEAVQRYGGPLARLRAAGAENETGLHFSLGDHLRALDGPLLCRYLSSCGGYPPAQIAWFAAMPVIAGLGAWAVRRRGLGAALACGLCLAASYVFTVGYAAPRFLLPAYALLALPVAAGLMALGRPRLARIPVAAAVLGYFVLQAVTLAHWSSYERFTRSVDPATAAALQRAGLRSPCFLYGHNAVQVGYLTGCSSKGIISRFGGAKTPKSIIASIARHDWVGVLTTTKHAPATFLTTWTRVRLSFHDGRHRYVFLPPAR